MENHQDAAETPPQNDSGDATILLHHHHHEDHHQNNGGVGARVKFMCSYGGRIQPRSHDNQLSYVGGETKILSVDRGARFAHLQSKLAALCERSSFCVKYQLPGEDLDALITVADDEDVDYMMEEFDRLTRVLAPKPARLRIFLFPVQVTSNFGSNNDLNAVNLMSSAQVKDRKAQAQVSNADFLVFESSERNSDPVRRGLGENGLIGSDLVQKHIQDLQKLRIGEEQERRLEEQRNAIRRECSDQSLIRSENGDQNLFRKENGEENASGGGFGGSGDQIQVSEKVLATGEQYPVAEKVVVVSGEQFPVADKVYVTGDQYPVPEKVFVAGDQYPVNEKGTGDQYPVAEKVAVTGDQYQAKLADNVSLGTGYWTDKQQPQPIYIIPAPASMYPTQMGRPMTGYYPVQPVYAVPQAYNAPQKVSPDGKVTGNGFGYDNGIGKPMYYAPQPMVAPYQGMAVPTSVPATTYSVGVPTSVSGPTAYPADMRPAATFTQDGKVVQPNFPQASV